MMAATVPARAESFDGLACADLTLDGDGTYNPEIVITNGCDQVVFWRMCVNYKARIEREYFEGSLGAGESTRIETYPAEGEEFTFGAWAQIGSDMVREPEC